MKVQDIPRSDDDYASVALIDAAAALLTKRKRGIPDDFVVKLFGLAVPEDLERYSAEELAGIAEQSWSFLAEREAGLPKIRFEPAAAPRGISVLEIINDDMPFLVDSVIGELNQRGLDIRLFVHPVFVVERNVAGGLTNFKAARTVGGLRESFIHLHIDGVEDAAQRAEIVQAIEERPRRCAHLRAGLAADAGADSWRHRRIKREPAAASGRRDRRSDPISGMDRG